MIFFVGIGNEYLVGLDKPAISINATSIGKVEYILRLSWRIRRIIAVVCHHGNDIILSILQHIGYINDDRQETSKMLLHQLSVHPYLGFTHDGFKVEHQSLPLPGSISIEMLSVPYFSLIIHTATRLHREFFYAIRQ